MKWVVTKALSYLVWPNEVLVPYLTRLSLVVLVVQVRVAVVMVRSSTTTFDISGPAARANWGNISTNNKSPAITVVCIRFMHTLNSRSRQVFPKKVCLDEPIECGELYACLRKTKLLPPFFRLKEAVQF